MTKHIGKKIADRYFTTDQIGVGGMGVVLEAGLFDDPAQKVAIKIIERGGKLTFEDRLRFQKEASLMSQLYHPNIINFTEFGIEENPDAIGADQFYIVMELVKGKTLKEFIEEKPNRRLAIVDFLETAIQLASALDYIHSKDIIHRDIKPQNVMVRQFEEVLFGGFQVKILDFGVAKLGEARLFTGKIQASGIDEFAGTPLYMAPEQTPHLDAVADHRIDLYSLGCVLYECLVGKPPFKSDSRENVAVLHATQKPESISIMRPEVPPFIVKIVDSLLQKMPEDRYPSAFSLLADLYMAKMNLKNQSSSPPLPVGTKGEVNSISARLPLAGRTEEFGKLINFFNQVTTESARGRMSMLKSAPGCGKSRLLAEVREHLREKKVRFVSGAFCQYEGNLKLNAIANAYNEYLLRVIKSSPLEASRIRDRFQAILGSPAHHVASFIPGLAPFIEGIPEISLGEDALAGTGSTLDPKAFIDFNRSIFDDDEPVVFIFDDLHWADPHSLELIERLFIYSNSQKAYMILAFQEGPYTDYSRLEPFFNKFKKLKRRFQEINLAPLEQKTCDQLVGALLSSEEPLGNDLSQRLFQVSKGIPLRLIETVREYLLKNNVQYKEGAWRYTENTDKVGIAVTPSIDLVLNGLDTWHSEQKKILQIGAAFGSSFNVALVTKLTDFSELVILRGLQSSIKQGLIEIDYSHEDGAASYRFTHQKVKDAVYQSMELGRKASMHLQLGEYLLAKTPQNPDAVKVFLVANQFNRAFQSDSSTFSEEQLLKATRLNQQSAKEALRGSSFQAAERYLDRGLGIANALHSNSSHEVRNLQSMRAISAFMSRDYAQAQETLNFLKGTLPDELVFLRYLELVAYAGYVTESYQLIEEIAEKYASFDLASMKPKSGIIPPKLKRLIQEPLAAERSKLVKYLPKLSSRNVSQDMWSDLTLWDIHHWAVLVSGRSSLKRALEHNTIGILDLESQLPQVKRMDRLYLALADFAFLSFAKGNKSLGRDVLNQLTAKAGQRYHSILIYLYLVHFGMDKIYAEPRKLQKIEFLFQPLIGVPLRIQVWQQMLHLRLGYGLMQHGQFDEAEISLKHVLRSSNYRSWISPKAVAMLLFVYFIKGQRDTLLKAGQAYLKRREAIHARRGEVFPLVIQALIDFCQGDMNSLTSCFHELAERIHSCNQDEVLFAFEDDFLFVTCLSLCVFTASETGKDSFGEIYKDARGLVFAKAKKLSLSHPVASQFSQVMDLFAAEGKSDDALESFFKGYKAAKKFATIADSQGLKIWAFLSRLWAYDCYQEHKKEYPNIKSIRQVSGRHLDSEFTKFFFSHPFHSDVLSMRRWLAKHKVFGLLRIVEEKVGQSGQHFTRYYMPALKSQFEAIYLNLPTTLALDFLLSEGERTNVRMPSDLLNQAFSQIDQHYGAKNVYLLSQKGDEEAEVIFALKRDSMSAGISRAVDPYLGASEHPLFVPVVYQGASFGSSDSATAVQGHSSESTRLTGLTKNTQIVDHEGPVLNLTLPEDSATQALPLPSQGSEATEIKPSSVASTGVENSSESSTALSGVLPLYVNSERGVYILVEEAGRVYRHSPEESRMELSIFSTLFSSALASSLHFSTAWSLQPWKVQSYRAGAYDLEVCPWLETQMEGKLRKDRESVWFVGRNISDSRYLLVYLHIEGPKEVRETLSRTIWSHLHVLIDLEHKHRQDPITILTEDRLKKDIAGLCRSVNGFESLTKISSVFSFFGKNTGVVTSGQIGPYRPITLGAQHGIEPSNEAILRLKGGGLLRYWKVDAEFGITAPFIVGADTQKITSDRSSLLRSAVISEIAKKEDGESALGNLLKILQGVLEGFVPRCYVAVVLRETYDENLPRAN